MKNNNHVIRILDGMMRRLQTMSNERHVPVTDLVNQALGDFLCFHETDINLFDVINSVESHLTATSHFVTNVDLYNRVISIKSPIRYVYRPELKYKIAVTLTDSISIGKISVILRSHDISTLQCFFAFINLWVSLEEKYIKPQERIEYICDSGYFERKVYLPANERQISGQTMGAAISDYISAFDQLLKHYFTEYDNSGAEIEKMYCNFVQIGKLRI